MKEIKITSNGIKQAIDDLVDENERLQDKVYKLEDIIKEVRECINKKLNINSDYVDYDFGTELLRQELLGILDKVGEINESR